ncbi:hypothetical protein G7043_41165 [Lentzea sp. NEAU-D13]|uniref:Uncharacterized protein n=1 Tax=Lentzea alba TaxID=2714351 RepID=A0A7C9RX12_9PSEU|nr:hypothetical protein [Lentzea alba]NGY65325.1 hypothetical protein [Lentzea alba]
MTVPGVLLSSTDEMSWAWIGVRVRPALKMRDTGAFPNVTEPQRLAQTLTREHAWLANQWTTESDARWELRFCSDPRTKLLSCVLLGRVRDPDPCKAVQAAVRLRDRLTDSPMHVQTDPVLDAEEVSKHLVPGALDAKGTFEVRKRLEWADCTRPDTQRRYCFAVSPALPPADLSWEPLWRELAHAAEPTVLSVYLEPYRPTDALAADLHRLAAEYSHLSRPGVPSPVWNVLMRPDPFAVRTAPRYAHAAARYTSGTCFRTRISVISRSPLPRGFGELVAAKTGGGVAVSPPAGELDDIWHNLAALNRDWLDLTYAQGSPPDGMRESERILCDLSDLDEAALAFRLPYQVPGHLPLFDMSGRPRPHDSTTTER